MHACLRGQAAGTAINRAYSCQANQIVWAVVASPADDSSAHIQHALLSSRTICATIQYAGCAKANVAIGASTPHNAAVDVNAYIQQTLLSDQAVGAPIQYTGCAQANVAVGAVAIGCADNRSAYV